MATLFSANRVTIIKNSEKTCNHIQYGFFYADNGDVPITEFENTL